MMVDSMAAKYGKLPTEILQHATTLDLEFHSHAETLRIREMKKSAGEDISGTYTQAEIQEARKNWRKTSE